MPMDPLVFCFKHSGDHRDLHSFPTRRSSDLSLRGPFRKLKGDLISAKTRLAECGKGENGERDRKSTRLNSSHRTISYAVFCLKKKKHNETETTDTKDRKVGRPIAVHLTLREH